MKRLFRTSKAGTVDPLPPPAPQSTQSPPTLQQQQQHQQQQQQQLQQQPMAARPAGKKAMAGMAGMFGGNDGRDGRDGRDGAEAHGHGAGHHHHQFESKPRQGNVTPFPLDMGRDVLGPGSTPTPLPPAVKSKGREKAMSISSPPSLLELQQMQAQSAQPTEIDMRRDEWLASQQKQQRQATPPTGYPRAQSPLHPIIPPPRQRRPYDNTPSPDGWVNVNVNGPGPGQIQPSSLGQSPSNASTPTIQQSQLYLPPGARPPSPQVRPGTPTRPGYPSSLGHHSQSSLQYAEMDPYTTNSAPCRDRGYSSASGSMRGSDHESSAHGHLAREQATSPLPQKMSVPKNSQPMASRSPLSHHYAMPAMTDSSTPYASNPPPPLSYPVSHQAYAPMVQEMSAIRIEGPSPEIEMPREAGGKDKEKKKFWGMGMDWGKKDGEKEREKQGRKKLDRPSMDEPRRSGERHRGEDKSSTGHGHSTEEEGGHRGRMLGLDIGGRLRDSYHPPPNASDNVTSAIQILCAHPNPPFSSTYEISERINHSSNSESVGKEAAQALRKQLKYGSDNEKRSAATMWLLMMRNVHAKGFRSHATGRKFIAVVEALLLAPSNKRLVTSSTHQAIAGILGDITYHFGGDKGSEALVELWKKVKLPQEADTGTPLPADFQAFQPETFYSSPVPGSFDPNGHPSAPSSYTTGSRRPSSPNGGMLGVHSIPPPLPQHGQSPHHMAGSGHGNVPSHGEDIRRLMDECTAAREAATVLAEALVFTRPNELELKPVIREFYRKCFLAHESLTNQIDWAQAEANQSRERAMFEASMNGTDEGSGLTTEEMALGELFETHSALAEALKQHDDMERMAVDEMEMREVRERSKKDTKMERNGCEASNLLAPGFNAGGSSSRSPSPVRHAQLPPADNPFVASPRPINSAALPVPHHYQSDSRSRTPSPDRFPPRIYNSPHRASSPLGQSVLAKARGPRPLPNPFSRTQNASTQSLSSAPKEADLQQSRSGTEISHEGQVDAMDADEDEGPPAKPSRKALGKRRVVEDVDNDFNPDDIFGMPKRPSSDSSHESVNAEHVYNALPVTYAYDAYEEKLKEEGQVERIRNASRPTDRVLGGGVGGSGSAMGSAMS